MTIFKFNELICQFGKHNECQLYLKKKKKKVTAISVAPCSCNKQRGLRQPRGLRHLGEEMLFLFFVLRRGDYIFFIKQNE